MFSTEGFQSADARFLLINKDLKVLHFDEEPILFSGLTEFGYRVLASLVDEDQDNEKKWFARYFYVILKGQQYAQFLSNKISYLQILQDSPTVFIVDRYYKSKSYKSCQTTLAKIPEDYIPTKDSYCPTTNSPYSLSYFVSLKGQLADHFYAVSSELSSIQESFSNLLSHAAIIMKSFFEDFQVYQSAYVPSSFQMSFDIVSKNKPNLFLNKEDFSEAFNSIVNYCFASLPNDVELLYGSENGLSESTAYNHLLKQIRSFYGKSITTPPENLEEIVKSSFHKVLYDLEGITKNIGKNYDRLDVFNKLNSGENVTLGELDQTDRDKIEDSVVLLESIDNSIFQDASARQYEIHIYSLNIDSRKGKADIRDELQVASKPRIKINGNGTLEGTKFSSSLHLNQFITVNAIGKWQKGRCISLEIEEG